MKMILRKLPVAIDISVLRRLPVLLRKRIPFWPALCGFFAVGLLGVAAVPGPAEEPSPRAQQIAQLEKQLAELKNKLVALKAADNGTTTGPEGTLSPEWVKTLHWRCIGPANMAGRITGLSVFEADPT